MAFAQVSPRETDCISGLTFALSYGGGLAEERENQREEVINGVNETIRV